MVKQEVTDYKRITIRKSRDEILKNTYILSISLNYPKKKKIDISSRWWNNTSQHLWGALNVKHVTTTGKVTENVRHMKDVVKETRVTLRKIPWMKLNGLQNHPTSSRFCDIHQREGNTRGELQMKCNFFDTRKIVVREHLCLFCTEYEQNQRLQSNKYRAFLEKLIQLEPYDRSKFQEPPEKLTFD